MEKYFITRAGKEALERKKAELKKKLKEVYDNKYKVIANGDYFTDPSFRCLDDDEIVIRYQLRDVTNKLNRAVIIEPTDEEIVDIGKKVEIEFKDENRRMIVEIADPELIDPLNGKISLNSPLGKAIKGKKAGEEVTYNTNNGSKRAKILRIF